MKKIFFTLAIFTLLFNSACSKDDDNSLGITNQDLIGVWEAEQHEEYYGGEVGTDRTIKWTITGTHVTEYIHEVSWDFVNAWIENTTEETYSYTYDAKKNQFKFDNRTYQIQTFESDDMLVSIEIIVDGGKGIEKIWFFLLNGIMIPLT